MEMMTPSVILVMNTFNVNRTKTVLFICMNCMRNYVQQEANCTAVSVRKLLKRCHFCMHFKPALQETQSQSKRFLCSRHSLPFHKFIDLFSCIYLTGASE